MVKVLFSWFKQILSRYNNILSPKKNNCMHEFQKYKTLEHKQHDQFENDLIFHLEGAILKPSSLFPYFFLVAFEAGGLLRALMFFLLYPFICIFQKDIHLKIMVFICFFGLKKENFRINRSVLQKFLLEDVGYEGYDIIARYKGKRVAVTDLPTVMVEVFLKDYIGANHVIERDLKVVYGYYVGFMEEKMSHFSNKLNEVLREHEEKKTNLTGFGCISRSFNQHFFSRCQEIYLVSEAEKNEWKILEKANYPKPLIFHDGRLSIRPTYLDTAVMFMWIPFGVPLSIVRLLAAVLLPYGIDLPILAILGLGGVVSGLESTSKEKGTKGTLYVSNHRTLLDPIYISIALGRNISAATYSISRVCELLSPLKTVSMFHGTTASGLKCLDPFFFLLNPYPRYNIHFLGKLSKSYPCSGGGKSRFEVANHVQTIIANFLKFECTKLTRKEKYIMLAGNEGIV